MSETCDALSHFHVWESQEKRQIQDKGLHNRTTRRNRGIAALRRAYAQMNTAFEKLASLEHGSDIREPDLSADAEQTPHTEPPFVSVIVPSRNEEKYIARCLDSLVANDYPKDRLESLVLDGRSEDKT